MRYLTNLLRSYLPVLLLISFTILVRTNKLEGKLTFEWDQARDYEAVSSMLKTGSAPLLGPIVRGEVGGFYLGPLYYYLITPLYISSNGNPLALAVVSIGADVLVIGFFYFFMLKLVGIYAALATSLIWAFSPLIITNAYTPWNVSLIPLWVLAYLIYSSRLSGNSHSFRDIWIFTLLSSLTTNIHLSLIPVVGVMLPLHFRRFLGLAHKQYLKLLLALVLPVSTLILHDLTHNFENTILFKRFLFGTASKTVDLMEIIGIIYEKFGYTIGRLLTGEPYTLLGWSTILISLIAALIIKQNKSVVRDSLLIIASILFSLLIYRDTDFAEYYFIPTFIPVLIMLGITLQAFLSRLPRFLPLLVVAVLVYYYLTLGLAVRAKDISPYSLTVKKMVVNEIKNLGYPTEIRTVLPRERNTGFEYLLKNAGVTSDPMAERKAYIYESNNMELIAPEDARSIILDKPFSAFKLVIFSN